MIKCEKTKCIIQGQVIIVEAEFICVCRAVKNALINGYGEACGTEMYKMLLKVAEMSGEEADMENSRMKAKNPFIAAMAEGATEMLMKQLFGGGETSPSSVEEDKECTMKELTPTKENV